MPKIQASPALSRFKVIDLSRVRAGPNCVRILTDFGADVVRVEPPEGVDPNEAMFAANRKGGDFQNINRNKRSMTLNLKKEGAMDILKRMIAEADVVVENNWINDSASNGQEAVSYASCERLKSFNNQDAAGKLLRAYDTGNNRWRLELQDELDDVYLPL